MALSIETYALAKKYADEVAAAGSKEALEKAIKEAVEQSKFYTDTVVSQLTSFKVQIVDTLPSTDIDTHTIYFLPKTTVTGEADVYYEYMYLNNMWELIGNTELSLDDYWTIDEVKEYVAMQEYTLPKATESQLGGVKIDDVSIQINSEGTISVKDTYTEEKATEVAQNIVDVNFVDITSTEINNLFNSL